MPIIKSAKKRVRVANKASVRNSKTKRVLKAALKLFASKSDNVSHNSAQSAVDKAVKKGVMHKNKAARVKKQLAAKAKSAGTASKASKSTAKKTTPKKVSKTGTKTAAKKQSTKKKPVTKK